jgi:hypothetical protein
VAQRTSAALRLSENTKELVAFHQDHEMKTLFDDYL